MSDVGIPLTCNRKILEGGTLIFLISLKVNPQFKVQCLFMVKDGYFSILYIVTPLSQTKKMTALRKEVEEVGSVDSWR